MSIVMRRWSAAACCCAWLLIATVVRAEAPSEPNPLGLPDLAVAKRGTLVICGGGRTPNSVYNEFVRLSGGKSARLVILPSAKSYSSTKAIERRFNGWRNYKVASLKFLDARSRDEANSAKFIRPIAEANGVWIPGGYQSRLARLYDGTKVEAALRGVLERGGVVGGSSAGAAILSEVIIRYGSPVEAVVDRGFGLVSRAVVDQHFSQRGRLPRLLGVLEKNPGLIGLGVDEGTALVVRGDRLRVVGNSRVTVCIPAVDAGPMLIYRLSSGERANLVAAKRPPEAMASSTHSTKDRRQAASQPRASASPAGLPFALSTTLVRLPAK